MDDHKRPARRLLAAALLALTAGCPDLEPPKIFEEEISEEECDERCIDQIFVAMPDGCVTVNCGIDIAGAATSDQVVVDLITSEHHACQVIVECPDGRCYDDEYMECLDDIGSFGLCEDVYDSCAWAEWCAGERVECDNAADDFHDQCVSQEIPSDETCDALYEIEKDLCACFEEACLGHVDSPECEPPAMYVSPPLQTGPQRWTVRRAFIDQQLARLGALSVETRSWPRITPAGQWLGVRLASVDPGEPAYALGLRSSDLVVAINGVPIIQALQNPAQLLALRDASTVFVALRRAGVLRQHRYDLVP